MKAAEVREMDGAALERQIQEAREEMFNMRFQMAVSKSVNTSRFRLLRRDIARMKTELNARRQEGSVNG